MPGVRVTSLRPKKDRKQSVCSAFGLLLLRVTDSPVRDSIQTVCRYCCGCCHRMQRRNQRKYARAERCKLRNRNRKRLFSVRRRARLRKKHPCCFCQRSLVIYHFVCLCFFSHFVFSQNYSEIAENSLCKFREWLPGEKHRREAFCGGVSAILNTSQIRKSDA